MYASVLRVMSSDDGQNGKPGRAAARKPKSSPAEDFAYKVELWDEKNLSVEQVLAVATSAAIAHAAFYAAAREFGERFITLRHKGNIINRWNGPIH